MANVNLLPWRQIQAKRQQRQFIGLLGVLMVLTLVFCAGLDWFIERDIEHIERQNGQLSAANARLDQQLGVVRRLKAEREALIARMTLIDQLQQQRNLPVRLFNQLPQLVPDGVFLSQLSWQKQHVEIQGHTQAPAALAKMMRNIESSGWLAQPQVGTLSAQHERGAGLSEFTLMFDIANPVGLSKQTKEP